MKIAQVCPRYFPDIGGVETHVKEISERLVKAGHDVEVITTDPTGRLNKEEMINGVKVIRLKSFAPGNAYYFSPEIYFYLKKRNYEVIHVHSYHALPALVAALSKHKGKFIFTPHYHRSGHTAFRDLLHKPYRFLGKTIFARADSVICVSEYEKRLVESDFNVAGKIVKIPNGINFQEFENVKNQKRNSADKKNRKEKVLLYVGRLEEYKGVQNIIQSLPELQDCRLKVVGKGPYEVELKNIANNLGIAQRVEWLKDLTKQELLECYANADVFLMLSAHEAYGITVAEALASGTPCVVAKGSALEEFVDGENCIGVDNPVSKYKVVKAIKDLEKNKKDKGHGLRSIMDWNEVSEEIVNVYGLTT